jgi:hypothetical protein
MRAAVAGIRVIESSLTGPNNRAGLMSAPVPWFEPVGSRHSPAYFVLAAGAGDFFTGIKSNLPVDVMKNSHSGPVAQPLT